MFWAEIPEAGKKSVLLSSEATCVPPRNIRQFVELLFEREDNELAAKILANYCSGIESKDIEPRRKTALGLAQLADLYATAPPQVMPAAIASIGTALANEGIPKSRAFCPRLLRASVRKLCSQEVSRAG